VLGGGRSRSCQGIRWSICDGGGRRKKQDRVQLSRAIVPHDKIANIKETLNEVRGD
jgi:hypothetical protein